MRTRSKIVGRHAADGGRVNPDESPAACALDDQALAMPTRHQLPAVTSDVHARGGRLIHGSFPFAHGMPWWRCDKARYLEENEKTYVLPTSRLEENLQWSLIERANAWHGKVTVI